MADKMDEKHQTFTPVLMVLCGIPACGKTYLANSMKEWSRRRTEAEAHFIHICYDDLIPPDLDLKTTLSNDYEQKEASLFEEKHIGVGNSAWKHYRKLIISCVERIIQQNLDNTFDLLYNEKSDVAQSASCEQPLMRDFWQIFDKQMERTDMSCSCLRTKKWVSVPHVLLVDDNMYYRSMRHEYFLLARKYSLGYMQVYIKCPVDTALEQNSQREIPIDRNTIITMAKKLEHPLPDKYPWELNSVVLDVKDVGSTFCLAKLLTMMAEAATNPVQPLPEENLELKEEARAANMVSIIHQADQTMRRVITNKMAKAKGEGFTRHEMKSLAENLNSKRKTFLEKLRTEDVLYMQPPHNTALSDTNTSNEFPSLGGNEPLNEKHLSVKHIEILTQLQNKEKFQETIKKLFECFVKGVK